MPDRHAHARAGGSFIVRYKFALSGVTPTRAREADLVGPPVRTCARHAHARKAGLQEATP